MDPYQPILDSIDQQHQCMCDRLVNWANLNSFTGNLLGLDRQHAALKEAFTELGGTIRSLEVAPQQVVEADGKVSARPLGKAISVIKRPQIRPRVFLGIHMDTVYAADHPFQQASLIDENCLGGPGVADAKGGLVVLLGALAAFERSPMAARLGWEVLINPDEEIASAGSKSLLHEAAARNDLGLVFEPSLPDGKLIGARKGSGNFAVVVHGRCAHAGRHFEDGRNAIHVLAEAILKLERLNGQRPDLTVNVGKVEGGGPVNVVPDLAITWLNSRVANDADQRFVEGQLQQIVADINQHNGFRAELHGEFTAVPKPMTDSLETLLGHLRDCGHEIGLEVEWESSGGVCDGNRLAAAGLTNVDTLGVVGGNLHSPKEYVLLESLPERTKLTALLLMKLADGSISWPIRSL